MYINQNESTLLGKICYFGPAGVGKSDLLHALYDHFAARDGANTHIDSKEFLPAAGLERTMSTDAAAAFMATAEKAFGAPYASLTQSGTLVWLRAALPHRPGPRTYSRTVDVFAACGPTQDPALQSYCLSGADAVVFVADGQPESNDATLEAWQSLRDSSFRGPIVLLANGVDSKAELAELLAFEGPASAEPGGFNGNLEAFETAAELALRRFAATN